MTRSVLYACLLVFGVSTIASAQAATTTSKPMLEICGDFGNPSELRIGENWYFTKQRGLRLNGEFIHVNHSPVGYTAYPMPVGANGPPSLSISK